MLVTARAAGFAVTLICLGASGCRDSTRPKIPDVSIGLFAMSEKADSRFAMAFVGPDGRSWYAEQPAGIDLSMCDRKRSSVMHNVDGNWAIYMELTPAAGFQVPEWTEKRIGGKLGVVVDGKLIAVHKLDYTIRSRFGLCCFASEAEARALCDRIKHGGAG